MSVFVPYSEDNIEEYYDDPNKKDNPLDLDDKFIYEIALYLKVGLFCGWDWRAFTETPLIVREAISLEIDNRLKPYLAAMASKSQKDGKSNNKNLLPLNFMHLSILLALGSMSGDD